MVNAINRTDQRSTGEQVDALPMGPQWRDITGWRDELAPSFDLASRLLGVTINPTLTPAAVSANLGANPSPTITAQAERAMSFWPLRGDADPRPALGSPYVRVGTVAASRPAVPGMMSW